MEDITFEEFKKLDIRTAKILTVEDIPGADKIYLLTVDLGAEQRKLVAGIKLNYPPDSLVGKTIVVLANIAPKVIRGVESHGMLLAVRVENDVTVLTVDKDVPIGMAIT